MTTVRPSPIVSFGIVPLLAFAGALSASLTSMLDLNLSLEGPHENYRFMALSSLVLGLVIALILGLFRAFQRWEKLLVFVFTVVAAHMLECLLDSYFPPQGRPCWDCSPEGFFSWGTALRFLFVSLIAFTGGLAFCEPRPRLGRLLAVALGISCVGSVAIGFLDSWSQWTHSDLIFDGRPLGLIWQPVFASLLGLGYWASCLAGSASSKLAGESAGSRPRMSPYIVFCICGIPLLVIVASGYAMMHHKTILFQQKQAQIDAEIARSKLETPPPADLPKISSVPLESILVAESIDDWKLYNPSTHHVDALVRETRTVFPEREEYWGSLASASSVDMVTVHITRYPNSNWTRYELDNTPTEDQLFRDESIRLVTRSGGTLYSNGLYFFWPSRDKLVLLDVGGILPDQVERILKAYLHKYPSDLQPSNSNSAGKP